MSITDILNKIKGYSGIDRLTIMYLCILVGVGIGAFYMGRLSMGDNTINTQNKAILGQIEPIKDPSLAINSNNSSTPTNSGSGAFVASKNGKLYYPRDCGAAKRISAKNLVYFNTAHDAEYEGYKPSTSCK